MLVPWCLFLVQVGADGHLECQAYVACAPGFGEVTFNTSRVCVPSAECPPETYFAGVSCQRYSNCSLSVDGLVSVTPVGQPCPTSATRALLCVFVALNTSSPTQKQCVVTSPCGPDEVFDGVDCVSAWRPCLGNDFEWRVRCSSPVCGVLFCAFHGVWLNVTCLCGGVAGRLACTPCVNPADADVSMPWCTPVPLVRSTPPNATLQALPAMGFGIVVPIVMLMYLFWRESRRGWPTVRPGTHYLAFSGRLHAVVNTKWCAVWLCQSHRGLDHPVTLRYPCTCLSCLALPRYELFQATFTAIAASSFVYYSSVVEAVQRGTGCVARMLWSS